MVKYLLCPSWKQLALLQHVVQGTATFRGSLCWHFSDRATWRHFLGFCVAVSELP